MRNAPKAAWMPGALKTRLSELEKDATGKPVKQLTFQDPDNISVQLADVSYVG